jgi:enterochelin esterase family protein
MKLPLRPLLLALAFVDAGFAVAADAPVTPPPAAAPKQKAPPRPISQVASPARTTDNVEFVIGPDYAYAPETIARDDVPKGRVHEFVMSSEDSKIYPGIARGQPGAVPYKRKVTLYIPSQYVPGTAAPFIVAQDGVRAYSAFLPTILDNLIQAKRVPAMIAIMIDSGGGDAQGSERGLEYDTVSGVYAEFLEAEVLPMIERNYQVKFTLDPEGRATMGGSSGGAAAFTMAWFHPEWYHRVLTYSGTYVNQQAPLNLDAPRDQWIYQPASPRGAWEYHAILIPESPRKPLKIWLHVSDEDNGANRDEASLHNWVLANQRMAAALKAKGYTYRYVFAEKAGHTDGRVTRQTLPGALEWLWSDYKPATAPK